MNAFVEQYDGLPVQVVAVNVGEPADFVEAWISGLGGVDFTVLLDTDSAVFDSYDFHAQGAFAPFPRQVVIDQRGAVRYLATQYYPDSLTQIIDALLIEETP